MRERGVVFGKKLGKVAFVSEDGLPDIRVEKMMNIVAAIAEEAHFIGRVSGKNMFSGIRYSKNQ